MASTKATPRSVRHWLFKSEPEDFGFDQLLSAPKRRTGWDGVRNHRARNFLRGDVAEGDLVLYYHSSVDPPGVAGIARVVAAGHPDPTQFEPRSEHYDEKSRRDAPTWFQVTIQAVQRLPRFVALDDLKQHPDLARMLVVQRGQRLSIQPVTPGEFRVVCALGGVSAGDF